MKKSYQKIKSNKAKIILASLIVSSAMLVPQSTFASEITPENLTYLINKERIYYGLHH